MIDLLYSEVDEELRSSLRSVLAARSPWTEVLARTESDKTYDADLWRAVAVDMGLAGLIVPEDLGGAGASYREAAVVCEELGPCRRSDPVPGQRHRRHHRAAVGGSHRPACRISRPARASRRSWCRSPRHQARSRRRVDRRGRASDRHGRPASPTRIPADLLLVPTADGLYAVEAAHASLIPVTSFDMTRQLADITFDGASGTLDRTHLAAVDAGCVPARRCWPRSSSGVADVVPRDHRRLPQDALPVRSAASAPTRRSSTGWRIFTSTSPRLGRSPATPPPAPRIG